MNDFFAGQDDEREAITLILKTEADRATPEPKQILMSIIEKVGKRNVRTMSEGSDQETNQIHVACSGCGFLHNTSIRCDYFQSLVDAIKFLQSDLVWAHDFEFIKDNLVALFTKNLVNPDRLVVELAERLIRA